MTTTDNASPRIAPQETRSRTVPAEQHRAEATPPNAAAPGQQHPLKLYFTVWFLLFVLSGCSYAVDYFDFHGALRWSLIILFMLLKAGAIVAVFMHMAWERLALVSAILLPPLAVLVFMLAMALEANSTNLSRLTFFGAGS